MKPGLIRLDDGPKARRPHLNPDITVRWAAPYFKSPFGKFTHRTRSGVAVVRGGKNLHVALHGWCGAFGFISKTSKCAILTEGVPEGETLCAICEFKAVRAKKEPTPSMSQKPDTAPIKTGIGITVAYCGHDAEIPHCDIVAVGNVLVVRANRPVTNDNLSRPIKEAALHMSDHLGGFWRPDLGVFVVPEEAVKHIELPT